MNIDEFKILLALNGNKRIEHLEEEIFADEHLTSYYLNYACSQANYFFKFNATLSRKDIIARHIYHYAKYVIKERWPAAECLILKSSCYARRYAENVINGEWPEARDIIEKDPDHWRLYNSWLSLLQYTEAHYEYSYTSTNDY